jgi:hypothetical protein
MAKSERIHLRISKAQKVRLFEVVQNLNNLGQTQDAKITVSAFLHLAVERAIKQAQRKVRERALKE